MVYNGLRGNSQCLTGRFTGDGRGLQGMGAVYMLVYTVVGAICIVCIALALQILQLTLQPPGKRNFPIWVLSLQYLCLFLTQDKLLAHSQPPPPPLQC